MHIHSTSTHTVIISIVYLVTTDNVGKQDMSLKLSLIPLSNVVNWNA